MTPLAGVDGMVSVVQCFMYSGRVVAVVTISVYRGGQGRTTSIPSTVRRRAKGRSKRETETLPTRNGHSMSFGNSRDVVT